MAGSSWVLLERSLKHYDSGFDCSEPSMAFTLEGAVAILRLDDGKANASLDGTSP